MTAEQNGPDLALLISCPFCLVRPGQKCKTFTNGTARKSHKARYNVLWLPRGQHNRYNQDKGRST